MIIKSKINVNIQLSTEEKKAINVTNDIITRIYKLIQEEANLDFFDFFRDYYDMSLCDLLNQMANSERFEKYLNQFLNNSEKR